MPYIQEPVIWPSRKCLSMNEPTRYNTHAPRYSDIQKADERIGKLVVKTPVLKSTELDDITGCKLYFKCENLQHGGAFKYRGASNVLLQLDRDTRSKGVATHSSGNHAKALSLVAKEQGCPAYIVMPKNASRVKADAIIEYGAEVTFCEPDLISREETLKEVLQKTGAHLVHPYDDRRIIAGQGTCAKELIEETDTLSQILVPVGGGGLASGVCICTKALLPHAKVIGVEPSLADDARRSLEAGRLMESTYPDTIADGLRTSLSPLTFSILKNGVFGISTASEKSIYLATRLLHKHLGLTVEPSGAVGLATLLDDASPHTGEDIGIILSGGNVDLSLFWDNFNNNHVDVNGR